MNKKFSIPVVFAVALLIVSSCAPVLQNFYIDVKDSNKLSYPVNGKSIAIFAIIPGSSNLETRYLVNDSSNMSQFCIDLARGLEDKLSLNAGEIPTFNIREDLLRANDSLSGEKLLEISSSDLVIILESLIYEKPVKNLDSNSLNFKVPTFISISGFDNDFGTLPSFSYSDTAYVELTPNEREYLDSDNIKSRLYSAISKSVGREMAHIIVPQWEPQLRQIYVYYNPEWIDAYMKAMSFKWDDAIKLWSAIIDEKKPKITSAAAYNIALACEMSGRLELALQWLEYSYKVLPSDDVLKYKLLIEAEIEKKEK